MNFLELEKQIETPFGRTPSNAGGEFRDFVKRAINNVILDISTRQQFRFLETTNDFITVGTHTTGTVAVTQDSKTVTGTATAWTADMVGRQFRVDGTNIVYQVATFVSGTSITLDRAYQDDTATVQNYSIFRNRYTLPIDFDHMTSVKERSRGIPLFENHSMEFDSFLPNPTATGVPRHYFIHGEEILTHSDGTVSVTNGSATVTGTGSNWETDKGNLNGVDDHIKRTFRVGTDDKTYVVASIESATSLTLERNYEGSTNASAAYTMKGKFKNIFLHPIPDARYEIEHKHFKVPAVLGQDIDVPDIPDKYDHIIVAGATHRVALFNRPDIAAGYFTTYEAGIVNMTEDNQVTSFRADQFERYRGGFIAPVHRIFGDVSTLR